MNAIYVGKIFSMCPVWRVMSYENSHWTVEKKNINAICMVKESVSHEFGNTYHRKLTQESNISKVTSAMNDRNLISYLLIKTSIEDLQPQEQLPLKLSALELSSKPTTRSLLRQPTTKWPRPVADDLC